MSTKLDLLGNLVSKVDILIIGGGMANTFLFAEGKPVGKSLCEKDLADTARSIVAAAEKAKCRILLPVDATAAKELKAHAAAHVVDVDHIAEDEMILDIGPKSVAGVEEVLGQIKTLVWNGPVGAFETPPFDAATMAIAKTAALLTKDGKLTSVAGGGDTVAALNEAKVADDFTYVSAAGGAFLEWMEGKALPGVEALRVKEGPASRLGRQTSRACPALHRSHEERRLRCANARMCIMFRVIHNGGSRGDADQYRNR